MAGNGGILGGAYGGDSSQGGVLGALTPGNNTLSLIGAALSDVSAHLAGRPEDATNVAQFQRMSGQRQLLTGLTSQDPTVRAQAYTMAPAFGVDPSMFQKAQASAAMPKLLSTMGTPQQTIAPVQVTPEVSAQDPLSDPSRAAAADAGMVKPGLMDALQQVNSPELTSQYAPDIIKQQLEMQQKAATTLTPQETAAAGFKPGTIVQRDLYGNLTVKQASDIKSDAAIKQQIALENANPELAISRANLGVAQQHLALDKQKLNDSLIDPLTRSQMAQQYLAGDPSVMTGLARGNPANIPLVRAEIQRQATQAGMKGGDIATKMAEFKGLTAGERALGTRTAQVGMASNEFAPMADQAQSAMGALGPSGFMPLAKLEQAYQQNTNDPTLAKAVAANNAVINTYARLINPNGVPTDSDKQHARDMLSTAQSYPAYVATLNQMRNEGQIAKAAPSQARSEIGALFQGNAAKPGVPAAPVNIPRLAPITKTIGGNSYSSPDGGKTWYHQ